MTTILWPDLIAVEYGLFTDEIERRRMYVVRLMKLEAKLGICVVSGRNLLAGMGNLDSVDPDAHQFVPSQLLRQFVRRNPQRGLANGISDAARFFDFRAKKSFRDKFDGGAGEGTSIEQHSASEGRHAAASSVHL